MPVYIVPKTIAPPQSRYSHGVLHERSGKRLVISGQVGVRPDGTVADGLEAQMEQAYKNLLAILAEGGMDVSDIVKVTAFATVKGAAGQHREVRGRHLGDHAPASTYLEVAGLARGDFLFEVEAEAVREG